MKLPKNWNKLTNDEQLTWVSHKLQEVRNEERELSEMLRRLVLSPVSIKVEERPDVEQLKA